MIGKKTGAHYVLYRDVLEAFTTCGAQSFGALKLLKVCTVLRYSWVLTHFVIHRCHSLLLFIVFL